MDRSYYQTTSWIGADTTEGSIGGTAGSSAGVYVGGTAGSSAGVYVGGYAGSSVGGYVGGAVGGYVGGTVGGAVGGTVGGAVGGTVGGYVGGAAGGSVESAAGGSVGLDTRRSDGGGVNGNYEDYDYQFTLTNGFGNRYQTYNDIEDYVRNSQEAMMQAVFNGLPTPRFSGPVSSSSFNFSEPGTLHADLDQQAYELENEYQQFSLPLSTHWSPVTRYNYSHLATSIVNEHTSTVTEGFVENVDLDLGAINMSIVEDENMEEERDVPEQTNNEDYANAAVEGSGLADIQQEALNESNLNTGFGEDEEVETCCENMKLVEL